jgi:hypothetical protein
MSEENVKTVNCPHCGQLIVIEQVNCSIFRCAVYKHSGEQLNPHAPREECDRLAEQGLIYGCGKPFRVLPQADRTLLAEACDYI